MLIDITDGRQADFLLEQAMVVTRDKERQTERGQLLRDVNDALNVAARLGVDAAIKQRIKDQQAGRLALGAVVSTGAVLLASDGRVSGSGPSNYSEKQELMRTGWRPNSNGSTSSYATLAQT